MLWILCTYVVADPMVITECITCKCINCSNTVDVFASEAFNNQNWLVGSAIWVQFRVEIGPNKAGAAITEPSI